MKRILPATMLMLGAPVVSVAQSPATASTPSACVEAVRTELRQHAMAAQSAGRPFDKDSAHAIIVQNTRACLARFAVASIDASELPPLATLALGAEQPKVAQQAFDRMIALAGANDSARAGALLGAERTFMFSGDTSLIPTGEAYLARLDSITGAPMQRITGYMMASSYYSNYDIDDKLGVSARRILEIVRAMPAAQQREAAEPVIDAYQNLAALQANMLHPDSAIAILRAAPAQWTAIDTLAKAFEEDVNRYSMIGKPAAPLHADY